MIELSALTTQTAPDILSLIAAVEAPVPAESIDSSAEAQFDFSAILTGLTGQGEPRKPADEPASKLPLSVEIDPVLIAGDDAVTALVDSGALSGLHSLRSSQSGFRDSGFALARLRFADGPPLVSQPVTELPDIWSDVKKLEVTVGYEQPSPAGQSEILPAQLPIPSVQIAEGDKLRGALTEPPSLIQATPQAMEFAARYADAQHQAEAPAMIQATPQAMEFVARYADAQHQADDSQDWRSDSARDVPARPVEQASKHPVDVAGGAEFIYSPKKPMPGLRAIPHTGSKADTGDTDRKVPEGPRTVSETAATPSIPSVSARTPEGVERAVAAHHVDIPPRPQLQIVRTINMEVGESESQVTIRLQERAGGVVLQLGAATETLRDGLQASVANLEQRLRRAEVDISSIEVSRKSPIDKVRRLKEAH